VETTTRDVPGANLSDAAYQLAIKIATRSMTPAQIAEAQRMARKWVAKHQK